jgi:photosystem II stability/assembly factor-like uncharacterized protein
MFHSGNLQSFEIHKRAWESKTRRANSPWRLAVAVAALFLSGLCVVPTARAQQYDPNLYAGMRWRQIGPFRAGRVTAVAGIPGNPAVYFIGTAGGGIWKTDNAGLTWHPIFDQEHVASIGAMETAPSDPKIIYVGTGDVSDVGQAANQGRGMFKSTDGGKTWENIGLSDTRHIGDIWIDPHNPNIVLVAALGHTYAKNADRGVYKTTDGGKTWTKVLYKDDVTGGINLAFDPKNPQVGFAALWHHYVTLKNPMEAIVGGEDGGFIYKTTDGGNTWTPAGMEGLPPSDKTGRIGLAVAPGGERVYAIVAAPKDGGLYRSEDGGQTWKKITDDARIQGSGYFGRVYLDPTNPDIVYVMQTSMYRSTDAGHHFISFKGAPGGDDNHVLWIDPANTNWMIMGSDQGGTVSLDGGKSWSSWYNQPTGQIYHLSVDNRWPFWVYGTQQDSGSIGGLSRGDYGAITMLDWDPVAGYEFGYIVPDPLDPNMIYAGGPGRSVVRIDRTNRQVRTVSVNVSHDGDYRMAENPPLAFSPQDPHVLYEATQFVLETKDGGMTWKTISPDLTKNPGETKPKDGKKKTPDHEAINTLAPSPMRAGVIWAGTTNGIIQLTRDGGKTWKDVSPAGLGPGCLINIIEASPFNAGAAYATVDRYELNDFNPHIYRTDDYGRTWKEIDAGLPAGSFVRVVREDPVRKGLLYAGTESGGVYVSFDDGDHWQSLHLNLPTVSVRDMVVHDSDLVAATYGRAFWILDDLTPLRQIDSRVASSQAFLFRPKNAIRVRRDLNGDTPFPPEMPAGKNPPNGAIIDYYLKSPPAGNVMLSIYTTKGQLVRAFSSAPLAARHWPPPPVPSYWLLHPKPLSTKAGMHRFVWDLRYTSPESLRHEYPISAVVHDTPADPRGPFVVPGKYEVRLTVDGRTYKQPLEVTLDPRVSATQAELESQLKLGQSLVKLMSAAYHGHDQVSALRKTIDSRENSLKGKDDAKTALAALKSLDEKAEKLESTGGGRSFGAPHPKPSFGLLNNELGSLLSVVEGADMPPTEGMQTAYADYCQDLSKVSSEWTALQTHDVAAVNTQLAALHLEPLKAPAGPAIDPSCGK